MEKIIAAIASAAALIAAFVLGRITGSGSNDRQRDIRRAFDGIGKTVDEVGKTLETALPKLQLPWLAL